MLQRLWLGFVGFVGLIGFIRPGSSLLGKFWRGSFKGLRIGFAGFTVFGFRVAVLLRG